MAEVPVERQFAGQARLIRLLLWKIGDTTDIDICLTAAQDQGMIDKEDRAFLDACMAAEEAMRPKGTEPNGVVSAPADASTTLSIDTETVKRLRRCADKLNRADSA